MKIEHIFESWVKVQDNERETFNSLTPVWKSFTGPAQVRQTQFHVVFSSKGELISEFGRNSVNLELT